MESSELSQAPFGELLKTYRKRAKLTQRQLAARLDVHYNTVWSWEQGDHLPDTRGLVLELAKHLGLDEHDTGHLLEASLTTISAYWQVPYQRNRFFTGREEMLERLRALLCQHQAAALTQSYALHGLGGIGKTQLAVEYAYRYALSYAAVFWIRADSEENIVAGFLAIANVLGLPEREAADQQRVLAAVQRWLTTHSQWLLIWDNVEDLELLLHFLPQARQGAILLTTRLQALGPLAQGLELPTMTPEEGIQLVLRRANVLPSSVSERTLPQLAARLPGEYAAARELARLMDGLPLALDQAGAYMEETGCGLADYLERYEQQRERLLARRGSPPGDHPDSVTATFTLAMERVARMHPAAAELLQICAFVHAEAIPEELFGAGAFPPEAGLDPVAADPSQLDLAIAALRTFSLVQRHPQTHTLSIHRLVQAVLHECMNPQERAQMQKRTIRLLNVLFPEVTQETWSQCERLLPHVLTAVNALSCDAQDQGLAELLGKAATYLKQRGQYGQAETLYRQALHAREQTEGTAQLEVVRLLDGLATLYRVQGKYGQAEALYRQALSIQEQTEGTAQPGVASLLNGLAIVYREQGRYAEAEPLFQRALGIFEQELLRDHPDTARTLNGLAILYAMQGRYTEAESLFQRALYTWEQAQGPDHPDVAYSLNNLANLYLKQGRYAEVEPLYQRALRLREQAQGPDHPDLAHALSNLAILYGTEGRYAEAEPLLQRALYIWEQAHGPDHPDVAYPLNGLANLCTKQGRYAEAEPLYQRALRVREQEGLLTPETTEVLSDFAAFHYIQGNMQEALVLYRRALALCTQFLGLQHPKTRETRDRTIALLYEMGQPDEAADVEKEGTY